MRSAYAAALALTAPAALHAQATSFDLSTATPIAGSWTYAETADGSEARFANPSALPQLTIHCTRAARRVTIAKPATGAAAAMIVWTSSAARSVPASFNPVTQRITIDVVAF